MNEKYQELLSILRSYGSLAIAFSGGVDSSFLVAAAHEALGENAVAITALAPNFSAQEIREAKEFCHRFGIRQLTARFDPLSVREFRENAPERCYFCKKSLFGKICAIAQREGLAAVAEGSNADDTGDYRPGMRAVFEMGIKSPLLAAGLNKREIREMSQKMGLPTWDKPSFACLASRIPYGDEITKEALSKVEEAEEYLRHMGFRQCRVRAHGDLARIELVGEDFARLLSDAARMEVSEAIKAIGFTYVSLDLLGYRTGSMNEVLSAPKERKVQEHTASD